MAELDKLVVKIEADLKDLKKGMAQANATVKKSSTDIQKSVAGIASKFGNLSTRIVKFGTVAAGVMTGVFLKSVVDVGLQIESLEIRLKSLFGSASEGSKAFDNMVKFAAQVPFSLNEIQQASGNLAVVSDDADHLAKILAITGNVAAVTGLSFRQTAEQIQRSFAGGIAAADVFRERGVRSMLGFEAGATVTAEETIKKFEEVFGKGGRLGNVTDELANTLGGTLTMLGDKFFAFQKAVAEGFFAELRFQFAQFNEFLAKNEDEIIAFGKELGKSLAELTRTMADNIDTIKAFFKALAGAVVIAALGNLVIALSGVTKALGVMFAFLAANPIAATFIAIGTGVVILTKAILHFRDQTEEMKAAAKAMKEEIANTVMSGLKDYAVLDIRNRELHEKELSAMRKAKKAQEKIAKEAQKKMIEVATEQNKMFLEGLEDRTKMENALAEKQIQEIEKTMQKQMDIFNEAGNAISKAFADAVVHGKDFKDAMYNIFQSVIAQVIQLIVQLTIIQPLLDNIKKSFQGTGGSGIGGFIGSAAKSFFGGFFGGGKAAGGSVMANTPYLVGEKGAEMFVPNQAGRIVPNNQLGMGGGTVNQTLNITTGVAQTVRAEVMNLMPVIKQETLAAVVDARRKGGSFARTFGA